MTDLWVRLGRRLLAAAFLAFPADFRAAHQEDALLYFEDRARAAATRRGRASMAWLVVSAVVSALAAGIGERLSRVRSGVFGSAGAMVDIRYGVRVLRRKPRFVLAAVVPIALGVGGVSAVFAVVEGVLLRPLPYDQPEELVQVGRPLASGALAPLSTANTVDVEEGLTAFETLGGVTGGTLVMNPGTDPVLVRVSRPTRRFLDVFHLAPSLGRSFAEEEFQNPDVAMVTWDFWQGPLGGNPSVLGSTVQTEAGTYRVVGVLPASWEPPEALRGAADGALWIPADYRSSALERTRAFGLTPSVGRLAPGATLEDANAQLKRAALALAEAHPRANHERDGTPRRMEARPLHAQTVGDVATRLLLLLGVVGVVLGIACANVANLFLARSSAREREFAMRTALGAGRGRLTVQLLAESLTVALLGGGVGLLLAHVSLESLVALTPDLPRADSVVMDLGVALVSVGVSVVCGVAFGLIPAWTTSQRDPGQVLRGGGRGGRSGDRLRGGLVVAQTAMAAALVVGCGLLANSVVRLGRVDPGVDAQGVLTFRPRLDPRVFGGAAGPAAPYYRSLVEAVARVGGVRSVSGSMFVPGEGLPVSVGVRRPEEAEELRLWKNTVLPYFFETVGIPMVEGRGFDPRLGPGDGPEAVVSRTFARTVWQGSAVVGRAMTVNDGSRDLTYTVVGVVEDVRDGGPRQPAEGVFYESYYQNPWLPSLAMFVRHDGTAAAVTGALRDAVREVKPVVPPPTVERLPDVLARHTTVERHLATLLGVSSLIALIIAAVGVYATLSYAVARQLREMGIRRAIGAHGTHVAGLVYRRGLALVSLGVMLGLAVGAVAARSLKGLLFGIGFLDVATYATAALVLLSAGLAACATPALRAARADPLTILRDE